MANNLGARYVLEGSVRKSGERVRVSSQLIDSTTGHHLWADKYDRTIKDMFELQDEMTQRIAATVAPELERAERKRVTLNTPNPDAWDLYHRGMSCFYEATKESSARAREYFERAIAKDPSYSRTYAGLALIYHDDVAVWHVPERDETLAKALAAAQQSIKLDDTDSYAHTMLGNVQMRMGKHDLGIAHCRRAIALNPSNALAYMILGNALTFSGQPEDGIFNIEVGFRLNPEEPNTHYFFNMLARAHLTAQKYNEAVGYAQDSLILRSSDPWPYLILASALGHLGKANEASSALAECERLQPGRTAIEFEELPRIHRNLDDAEHILEGIRKAGWSG